MSVYEIADEDIALVEDAARKFVQTEVAPHLGAWEEAGEIPRSLYQRAAEMGWLEMGYPEEFGGTPSPWKLRNALTIALARAGGSGGLMASLFSHNIGLPPVVRHGSPELQRKVIPDVLAGKKIAALAITEPGGGTDVSALKTTARREGDEYVIDGEKVFITSGVRADWLTVAVRTDLKNKGPMGISMVMVPGDAVGLSRSPLKKMGWLCSDTAQIRFDGVRVPVSNLVGEEGSGFKLILTNFNGERLSMAALSLGFAPDSELRVRAAIRHVLSASREQGHCYLIITQIVAQVEELLNLRLAETIPTHLEVMQQEGQLRVRLLVPWSSTRQSCRRCRWWPTDPSRGLPCRCCSSSCKPVPTTWRASGRPSRPVTSWRRSARCTCSSRAARRWARWRMANGQTC